MSRFFDGIRARSLRRRSVALLNSGKSAEALPLCQEVVALSPQSAGAWSDLGWALKANQRLAEAIAAYETAISLNPNHVWAWNNKGAALTDLRRYEEALSALDRACALDPGWAPQTSIKLQRNRLLPLLRLNRFDEVIAATDMLVQSAPRDDMIWVRRGQALAARRRYDEAEEAFQFAANLKPQSIAPSHLVLLYTTVNEYDKALEIAERMLASRPNDAGAWHLKGIIVADSGAYEDGLSAYRRAIALGGFNDYDLGRVWSSVGYALSRVGRFREALEALDTAISLAPSLAFAFISRGEVFSHIERESDALLCYEDAYKADPYVLLAQTNIADALVMLGGLDQAKAHVDHVFAADSDHACAWNVTGLRETALGNYGAALAAFDKAIAFEPCHASHYIGFAELLLKLDDPEHACRVAERATTLDPYYARAWKVKAQALRAVGDDDEATAAEQRGAELLADQTAQVDVYLRTKARPGASDE